MKQYQSPSIAKNCSVLFGLIAVLLLPALPVDANGAVIERLCRVPDRVRVISETQTNTLINVAGVWQGGGITVITQTNQEALQIAITSPSEALKWIEVRWAAKMPLNWKYLGDAWERAYGDLGWQSFSPPRILPWYFLTSDGVNTYGVGVKTGPAAICHWTVDAEGVTLHADIRSGGVGVQLGDRTLAVCEVVCRENQSGESPFVAARKFCRVMCAHPRLPRQPVYGFNDWYCAYGANTAREFLATTAYLTTLAPTNNRPFALIDDGWQVAGEKENYPPWSRANSRFSPSMTMAEVAQKIQHLGARPGIWVRPLQAFPNQPATWRLARNSKVLDPTVPEVRAYVHHTIQRLQEWQFDLIKHDFTTFELLGAWGKDMTTQITGDGWAFAHRDQTTAEIIRELYQEIRDAAGAETIIIGCNTIGHLAAGLFELQRIGDDTSGREWARTVKMGVNCLAFRGVQDGAFFAVDADCVGQSATESTITWAQNRQWLELLSRSGTPCFLSFAREVMTPEREPELRRALEAAAQAQPLAEPLDWMDTLQPRRWRLNERSATFTW